MADPIKLLTEDDLNSISHPIKVYRVPYSKNKTTINCNPNCFYRITNFSAFGDAFSVSLENDATSIAMALKTGAIVEFDNVLAYKVSRNPNSSNQVIVSSSSLTFTVEKIVIGANSRSIVEEISIDSYL